MNQKITDPESFIEHRAEILQTFWLILWKIDDFINPIQLNHFNNPKSALNKCNELASHF